MAMGKHRPSSARARRTETSLEKCSPGLCPRNTVWGRSPGIPAFLKKILNGSDAEVENLSGSVTPARDMTPVMGGMARLHPLPHAFKEEMDSPKQHRAATLNRPRYGLGPVDFPCPLLGELSCEVASFSSTPAMVSHRNPEYPAPCSREGQVSVPPF